MLLRTILACAALLLAPACSSNSCKTAHDCDATQRCVNQACRGQGDTLGTVGDSCASTSQCASALTCDTSASFPNGLCTASCSGSATCPAGACVTVAGAATCAGTCAADTDCRSGYGCCASMGNVCLPPSACVPAACDRPIVASALPSQVLKHEAHHKTGDNVAFTVPAGTGSISIVQQAEVANLTVVYQGHVLGNSAVPGVILKPDGSKAYDDNDTSFSPGASPDGGVDPSGLYSYFSADMPSTGAFTIPATSASLSAGVPAGNWQFTVNDYAYECAQPGSGCSDGGVANNTYDVTVMARPAPAPGATATMNVAFYIVADVNTPGGQPFTAANAASDPSAQRLVTTLKDIFSGGGITIGTVTFYDVSAADRSRFGTHISADRTEPCDELNQMFTLSGAHPGNAMNLFLVQGISSTDQGGGSVVGIDGTIPGPASFAGTVHSGAAVSLANLFQGAPCLGPTDLGSCGADLVAFIAAHEAGHFLGLFHTTESDGRYFDPLTDTAKCPCTTCAAAKDLPNCATGGSGSSTVFLQANQCVSGACGGGSNLMFWQLKPAISQGIITAQQGQVMRLNAAVQ